MVISKVVIAGAFIGLAACSGDRTEFDARVQHWKSSIEAAAIPGTPRAQLEAWAKENGIQFHYLQQQHELYANVETLPEPGLKFPCSKWNVIAEISLDADDRAVVSHVQTVGTCL